MDIKKTIKDYLENRLSEPERAAFERALDRDEMLQRLVEERRQGRGGI